MKKLVFVILLSFGTLSMLQAVEIPVSIAMDESLPYRREFRYYLVKALSDIENIKIVEPGQGDWFRIRVLLIEMRLENKTSVGYALSYTIVEVPFYIHSYIFQNLDSAKRQEGMDKLINNTVLYHGSDLITTGKDGLESPTEQIYTSLKKIIEKRIRVQEE